MYEGFFREQKYGLMNQTFGGWFRDQLIALALSLVFGGLLVAALIAIVRRLPRTWHIWGTAVAIVFLVLGAVIAPVFIAPLFNTYKPLANTADQAADSESGACQWHSSLRRVRGGRVEAEQPGQRQRQRPFRHGAHHAERQPAEARLARGHSLDHGP